MRKKLTDNAGKGQKIHLVISLERVNSWSGDSWKNLQTKHNYIYPFESALHVHPHVLALGLLSVNCFLQQPCPLDVATATLQLHLLYVAANSRWTCCPNQLRSVLPLWPLCVARRLASRVLGRPSNGVMLYSLRRILKTTASYRVHICLFPCEIRFEAAAGMFYSDQSSNAR